MPGGSLLNFFLAIWFFFVEAGHTLDSYSSECGLNWRLYRVRKISSTSIVKVLKINPSIRLAFIIGGFNGFCLMSTMIPKFQFQILNGISFFIFWDDVIASFLYCCLFLRVCICVGFKDRSRFSVLPFILVMFNLQTWGLLLFLVRVEFSIIRNEFGCWIHYASCKSLTYKKNSSSPRTTTGGTSIFKGYISICF